MNTLYHRMNIIKAIYHLPSHTLKYEYLPSTSAILVSLEAFRRLFFDFDNHDNDNDKNDDRGGMPIKKHIFREMLDDGQSATTTENRINWILITFKFFPSLTPLASMKMYTTLSPNKNIIIKYQ